MHFPPSERIVLLSYHLPLQVLKRNIKTVKNCQGVQLSVAIIIFIIFNIFHHLSRQNFALLRLVPIFQIIVETMSCNIKCSVKRNDSAVIVQSSVFMTINFILSFLQTSDVWLQKKRWLPPKIHSVAYFPL